MHFHIITIFPDAIRPYLNESILGRAQKKKLIKISYYNPRDFTKDKHKKVDDIPYGGGPGMVMNAEPILKAVKKAVGRKKNVKMILLSPHGKKFTNRYAKRISSIKDIILISGRYEGIDNRVVEVLKPELISVGDYVLTGGELPAMTIVDVVSRQIRGVLGKNESIEEKRVAGKKVYTRPQSFTWRGKKKKVPKVLISGDHKKIEEYREK